MDRPVARHSTTRGYRKRGLRARRPAPRLPASTLSSELANVLASARMQWEESFAHLISVASLDVAEISLEPCAEHHFIVCDGNEADHVVIL